MKIKALPEKYFLSPSKAALLASYETPFPFIKKYLLKQKPEPTEAMNRGRRIHAMFYNLLMNHRDMTQAPEEFKELEIIHEPETWPTKKECGRTIVEQKEAFFENDEQIGGSRQIVRKAEKPIYESIDLFLKTSGFTDNFFPPLESLALEQVFTSPSKLLYGITDLHSSDTIIDIKTVSKTVDKDVIKWNWKTFAIQQIIYESLFKDDMGRAPKFYFLFIQTQWPFEIKLKRIPSDAVCYMETFFWNKIYPLYTNIIPVVAEIEKDMERLELNPSPEFLLSKAAKACGFPIRAEAERIEINQFEIKSLLREIETIRRK